MVPNAATFAIKTDGTLWAWGDNGYGKLGINQPPGSQYSSPIQIPGTTWPTDSRKMTVNAFIKTDGTWWGLGDNSRGQFAQNNNTEYSSPVQLPGTDWQYIMANMTSKTDGTLWGWGQNQGGQVGDNTSVWKSSPVQVPGTWDLSKSFGHGVIGAFKDA